MSSTSAKIRTLQEQAEFYLSPLGPKSQRRFWQTMNKERMKQKCFEFLKSDNVKQSTKEKVLTIIEQL